MQAQTREAVYWPGIDSDISNFVSWCTICTKHKVSLPAQPMLPRDIPDGPWQDITVDYMTHKSHEYLIICDAFSKYPFVYKVMSKSATSLCMHLLELIMQYGPPMSLSTANVHLLLQMSSQSSSCTITQPITHPPHISPGPMDSLRGKSELLRLPSTLLYQPTSP